MSREFEAIGYEGECVWIDENTNYFICCTCERPCVEGYRGECDECNSERCYDCATGSQRNECVKAERKTLLITKRFTKVEIRGEDADLFKSYSVFVHDTLAKQQKLSDLIMEIEMCQEFPGALLQLSLLDHDVVPLSIRFNSCEDDLDVFVTVIEENGELSIKQWCLNKEYQEI